MQIIDRVIDRPDRREQILAEFCNGDESLRGEVERLLAQQTAAADFLEESPLDAIAGVDPIIGKHFGPYRLTEQIGRGGMGAVYKASRDDQEYKTEVAIKLIKRGMDTDFILRRFRNERQILANLNHPNIARMLDGGTTDDGRPYFVMEYVDGLPIDDYCFSRKLSIRKTLELFRTVCSAVQHAHQNQVIHRDLKPSNVLVTQEGLPKLLDFGIAKLLQASDDNATALTATELRVMTPHYAAPEQINGEQITTATDVYSLGVVLYELLTGRRPYHFKSKNPGDVARVICEEQPLQPSKAASESLLVSRNGASRKSDTSDEIFETTNPATQNLNPKALRGDLDAIVMMSLRKEPARRYQSIKDFVADIDRYLEGRPITARKDSLNYRASKFVERNVVRHWRPVFVSLALFVVLVGLGFGFSNFWYGRGSTTPTKNVSPVAQEAYQKGRYLWNKRTDLAKAIEYFNTALSVDPNYAEAHAGIADAYVVLAMGQGKDERRTSIEKGRTAAGQAIRLDPKLAEPHATLGFIAYDYDWNWSAAEGEYRHAIDLNPNYPTAHHWYAYLLQNIGRNDEAISEIKRARDLDPLSPAINRDVGEILYIGRRYDEASDYLRKRLDIEPQDWRTRDLLASVYAKKGARAEAISELEKILVISERDPEILLRLAARYELVGRDDEAQKILSELKARGYEPTLSYFVDRGDKDKIFEWIERMYNDRNGVITNLKVHPIYDGIRSEPRYFEYIKKLGLP